MSNVPNSMGKTAEVIRLLRLELGNYSIETIKSAIAQSSLNAEQIKAILSAKGLTAAEIEEVIATNSLSASQAGATTSTLGLGTAFKGLGVKIKSTTKAMWTWLTTNPIGWATMAVTAIGGVIFGMSKLSEAEKKASEKADEMYEKSNTLVRQNKEEIESLDALISKYKELKEKESLDIEGRNEIKGIQNDIADLVGAQAKNLDLVNGKLDDQIKKLDEITEKEAKRAYQQAQANYYNAKDAADKAAPADEKVFFTDYDYAGKIETEARKALEEAGFGYYNSNGKLTSPVYGGGFGLDGIMGSRMVVKAAGGTAQEKYDYLQKMISTLEQYGQRNTEIYKGLIQQAGEYEKYIDQQQSSIESLMDSWMITSQYSNKNLSQITVDSMDTFEQYRQTMISEAKKDGSIGEAIADGVLSSEDIEKAVNDFMAVTGEFSEWYVKWQESILGTASSFSSFDISTYKEKIDEAQSSISTLRSALV